MFQLAYFIVVKVANKLIPPIKISELQSKKKRGSEERDAQIAVVKWLAHQYPDVLFCASAGGLRTSMTQAVNMKRMGYKAGFPDVFLYEPRGQYHGMAIEMKKMKGEVSKSQWEWIEALSKKGYFAIVAYGSGGAITEIERYLNARPS